MRYLNFILTVIALCLIYQCAQTSARPALAANGGPIQVKVVNSSGDPVPIELRRVSTMCGSLPVVIREH